MKCFYHINKWCRAIVSVRVQCKKQKKLNISIREFNKALDVLKIIGRARAVKVRKLPITACFLLQSHIPSAVTQRWLNCCSGHLCAPHSQAGIERVECGTWMLKVAPSFGVCWSADTYIGVLYRKRSSTSFPILCTYMSLAECKSCHHTSLKRSLRNVIFSLPASFIWIDRKDKKEVKVNAEYNRVLARHVTCRAYSEHFERLKKYIRQRNLSLSEHSF